METERPLLGTRLREERRRLGLTQAALAAVAGISTATQVGYEGGATDPGASYLLKIAEAGVDVCWVLTGQRVDWRGFDIGMLIEIVQAVDEWAATRNKMTTAEQREHLVRVIYEHCSRDGVLSPSFVESALKVAG